MTVTMIRQFTGPSAFIDGTLGLSTNETRPVRFHGRVKSHVYPLRLALQTLGELVWSDYRWMEAEDYDRWLETILDPVITVHPDRVFFEAFNQEQSAYGMVIADREIFETAGEVHHGTTNIDFTTTLHAALTQMRSSRETWFRVGPSGFGVQTASSDVDHFEEKVELPDTWVRGFLQLQGAMAMPGTRIELRPVDMKNIIRWLAEHRAYTSPRSIRWVFEPGRDVQAVVEPWDEVIECKGSSHNYTERKETRVWGRNRLALLDPLLGRAESVEVYLKGRALPSFYAVRLPGVVFVLGLSGWSSNSWTQAASFDLLTTASVERPWLDRAHAILRERYHIDEAALARELDCGLPTAASALSALCRHGRAIYDVRARNYRHRELFAEPIDPDEFYPPDPRQQAADAHLAAGRVSITLDEVREKRRSSTDDEGNVKVTIFENRVIEGDVAAQHTHIVVQDTGRVIFGRCTCAFFDENLMNKGPCEHMMALKQASEATGAKGW